MDRQLHIPDLLGQLGRILSERPRPSGKLVPVIVVRNRASDELTRVLVEDLAFSVDRSLGHRSFEVEVEVGGKHKDVLDKRVRREEGRVAEYFEVDVAMDRLQRVEILLPDGDTRLN